MLASQASKRCVLQHMTRVLYKNIEHLEHLYSHVSLMNKVQLIEINAFL